MYKITVHIIMNADIEIKTFIVSSAWCLNTFVRSPYKNISMARLIIRIGPFLLKDRYVQYPASMKKRGAENLLRITAIEYESMFSFSTMKSGMCCKSINTIAKPLRLSIICIRFVIA